MKGLKIPSFSSAPSQPRLDLAVGPHLRLGKGLAQVYQVWALALLPALCASFFYFGVPMLRVVGLCVCFALACDLLVEKFAPSRDLTSNWSSVSLALLLAFMMPLNAPWWLLLIGAMVMVIVGKKFFGGVGAYPVQPAVLAIAVLQVSWPQRMDYTAALKDLDWSVTMVEPLRLLKSIGTQAVHDYQWYDLLFGHQVAGVANGMVFFFLLGGAFLLLAREIQWQAPVGFFLGLVATATLLQFLNPAAFAPASFHLLSGGTVFMGLFLLTDHTTSPVNKRPLFLFGLLAGILLILIRAYSKHVDGIAFAVLLANLCAPLLDMIKPSIKGGRDV